MTMRQRNVIRALAMTTFAIVLMSRGHDEPRAWAAAAAAAAPVAGNSSTAGPLTAADIRAGMSKIAAKVQACHAQYRLPGLLKIKLTIHADGTVTSASALSSYSATPTGICAEKAVLTAKFKPNSGGTTVTYPFSLR